jgi:raffinose/stachyose/melibiose transport system substrate-binding protein
MDILDRFRSDHPNIKVEVENLPATKYHERLESDIASDTLPNVFQHWGGSELYDAVRAGKVLDLTERMDADKDLRSGFTAADLRDISVRYSDLDGLYGIPFSRFVSGFYYNKDMFRMAGIDRTPGTWSELLTDIGKLKAVDVIPWALGAKEGWRVEHVYTALFYRMDGIAAAGRLADRSLAYSSDEAVAPWEEIRKLASDGAFGPEPETVDFMMEQDLFESGKAAMDFSLSSFAGAYTGQACQVRDSVGFFNMPVYDGREQYAGELFGGCESAYGIAADASPEQLDASWELCRALCGPEGQTILAESNATIPANSRARLDSLNADPMFVQFTDELNSASHVMSDVCVLDTSATLLGKIRDVGVAVVNNQLTPRQAGSEIDQSLSDGD